MKVTILKTATALAGILLAAPAFAQTNGLGVTVNGQPVHFPGQGPVESGGRVLVPLRGVLEQLGAYVSYDSTRQEVRAVRNEEQIVLPIGADTARVDGRAVPLDAPARILNGSTLVPLRFVAEALGARVNYEPATSTVAIRTEGSDGNDQRPRPMPSDPRRLVRGTVIAVHRHDNSLVIQAQDGDRRDITMTPDYRARRRTPDGFVTMDLDRLQPGDRVALEMDHGLARTVTLLPDHADTNM